MGHRPAPGPAHHADDCLVGKRQVTDAGAHLSVQERAPRPGFVLARDPQVQVLGATKHSGSSGGVCGPSPWRPLGPSLPVTPSASQAPALWSPGDRVATGPVWGQPATEGHSWLQAVPGWEQVPAAEKDSLTQAQEATAAPFPLPPLGRPLREQVRRPTGREPPCSLPPLLGSGPRRGTLLTE